MSKDPVKHQSFSRCAGIKLDKDVNLNDDVRGHAQMTSAERGREGGTQILTVGGGGCVISIVKILTRGEGVKNPENLADVICEWPLTENQPMG